LSATGDWWNSLSKNEREEVLKKVYITKDNVINADDWEIIYLGDFDYLSYWVWGKLETYHDEVIQPKTKEEKEREENAELSSSDWWDRHGDAVIGKLTESKANEEGLDWTTPHTEDKNCQHPNCVGARAEDILFNNFVSLRGGGMKCNHCGKYWSDEPENTFNSAQVLNQPIVQDLLHHARTHGIEY